MHYTNTNTSEHLPVNLSHLRPQLLILLVDIIPQLTAIALDGLETSHLLNQVRNVVADALAALRYWVTVK